MELRLTALLDILDEDDDGDVEILEARKVIYSSFMQHPEGSAAKIEEVISSIFGKAMVVSKVALLKTIQ